VKTQNQELAATPLAVEHGSQGTGLLGGPEKGQF
jgi:hypothetical protein